jgi:hypothetical protein
MHWFVSVPSRYLIATAEFPVLRGGRKLAKRQTDKHTNDCHFPVPGQVCACVQKQLLSIGSAMAAVSMFVFFCSIEASVKVPFPIFRFCEILSTFMSF